MELQAKHEKRITFRLSEKIKQRTEALAEINNTTVAEIVRYALINLLQKSNV